MPVVSPEVRNAVSHLRRNTSAVENRAETAVDVGVHDMGPQGGPGPGFTPGRDRSPDPEQGR